MIDDPEIQLALDEKQDEILTGMPVPQDGKVGDIRTNIFHKGKAFSMMKAGLDTWLWSAPYSRTPSIHTMDDYLLKSGGKMLDNTILDAYDVTVRNDLLLSGSTAGTDDTVLVLNGADGMVVTDEIDSRVWGATLVNWGGTTPTAGHIPYFSDPNTIDMDSGQLFWDAVNNRLGVGIGVPLYPVHIDGTRGNSSIFVVDDSDQANRARFGIGIFEEYAELQSYGVGTSAGGLALNPQGNPVGIGVVPLAGAKATIEGSIKIKEQASAGADTAAYGQLWVKTATPNELWFTDDAGGDHQIAFV